MKKLLLILFVLNMTVGLIGFLVSLWNKEFNGFALASFCGWFLLTFKELGVLK